MSLEKSVLRSRAESGLVDYFEVVIAFVEVMGRSCSGTSTRGSRVSITRTDRSFLTSWKQRLRGPASWGWERIDGSVNA